MLKRTFHTARLGLKSLALHKLRSALTILGIVFGVGSVIVMLAVGEGARAEAVKQIKELGANNIILRSVKPARGAATVLGGAGIRYGLIPLDLDQIISSVPAIRSVVAIREHRNEVRYRDWSLTARVVAISPDYPDLERLRLRQGRFLTELDGHRGATVAILAAEVADQLFPMEDPIGKSVRIDADKYFQVVGVLESRGSVRGIGNGVPAQDYNEDVYIPFLTDRTRFTRGVVWDRTNMQMAEIVEITQITAAIDKTEQVREAAEIIQAVIRDNHRQDDVVVTVPLDLLQQAENAQRVFTIVLGAIASISLLVGGIGIMNIMLATVTERTREIGIRRALGAKRSDISRQFMVETLVLSVVGGTVGLGLGIAIAQGIAILFFISTIVSFWSLVVALGVAVAVGLLFGMYPARRAAYMDPIEALRHE